ncbi:hypothetical protein [Streptomyces qinzhouensis]|uniref:Uncharacterized protein n=1 Tax=Streptomyces qinzhouensis TaxID=2599401 RepID=A0A5B8J1W8_9ACTN|nr:hypothetical protein [Streptomyces qinzhouensis]QDY75146.1 hypothetical protein FQU76_00025 [Streptomyces qinzhouensis]QDY80652.1 hypothetical protein FQU76_33715 [Streptomyces qinzhouensis]
MRRIKVAALTAAALLTAGAGVAVARNADSGAPVQGDRAVSKAAAPFQRTFGDLVTVAAGQIGNATVSCPAGTVSTGGGGVNVGLVAGADTGRSFIIASFGGTTGWQVTVRNTNTVQEGIRAFVVCTTP